MKQKRVKEEETASASLSNSGCSGIKRLLPHRIVLLLFALGLSAGCWGLAEGFNILGGFGCLLACCALVYLKWSTIPDGDPSIARHALPWHLLAFLPPFSAGLFYFVTSKNGLTILFASMAFVVFYASAFRSRSMRRFIAVMSACVLPLLMIVFGSFLIDLFFNVGNKIAGPIGAQDHGAKRYLEIAFIVVYPFIAFYVYALNSCVRAHCDD
jgi:hypothetical protein